MTGRFEADPSDPAVSRRRTERTTDRRLTRQRRQQAEHLARHGRASARSDHWRSTPPVVYLLGVFFVLGTLGSVGIVAALPPEASRNQIALLLASGCAVWGLVGLTVVVTRRAAPPRQAAVIAYDALRQGLLIAGCLELNLATRLLDLWTPLIGALLVAVFALFEVVTLGRRPA
jgi:hypothetical protein